MTDELPQATPYPWDNEDMEEEQKIGNEAIKKRRFIGTGFASLYSQTFGRESALSDTARTILTELLRDNDVKIPEELDERQVESSKYFGGKLEKSRKNAAQAGMNDSDILELARDGKLSCFETILRVVDDNPDTAVPTKQIIKTCCLTFRPGDVPGTMDAKELILASLYFLSSTMEAGSDQIPSLPLIRPTLATGDLERRSYEKVGDWKLLDMGERILNLERSFTSSLSSWKWLSREKFSPRLTQKEESSFFLKGAIPASATAKKPKAEGAGRKRKASSTTPPAGGQSAAAKRSS